jgi:putative flippase GtrA
MTRCIAYAFRLCAAMWRNEHSRRFLKFLLTGLVSTAAGLEVLSIEVHRGVEQNRANFYQGAAFFILLFPIYRYRVFGREKSGIAMSFGRWLSIKLSTLFILAPAVFFLVSLTGTPYWVNSLAASAVSGAYSFLMGYWAFGLRRLIRRSSGV